MTHLNEDQLIMILKKVSLFQGIDEDNLKSLIPILEPHEYPADQQIIKEGTSGESMFIISEGTVKVTKDENVESIIISFLYAGSYFGEFSLIDNLPRSASVTTVEPTIIFKLKRDTFNNFLQSNIVFSNKFYKNCITETFSRFRNIMSHLTFSQTILNERSSELAEINKDLDHAKRLQDYFIGTGFIEKEKDLESKIHHSYIYHPCITIGGDFFNIQKLDENLIGLMIADVMGHGITAAMGTGVLKSAFSFLIDEYGKEPIELLNKMNAHYVDVISHQLYATCYYAIINISEHKITFAKAGHHHPLFWKKSTDTLAEIECPGTGLGLMKVAKFGVAEYSYEPGDKLLFFTDGIIEQKNNAGEMYMLNRLTEKYLHAIEQKEKKILNYIFGDLTVYAEDQHFEDDVTLLLLEL